MLDLNGENYLNLQNSCDLQFKMLKVNINCISK